MTSFKDTILSRSVRKSTTVNTKYTWELVPITVKHYETSYITLCVININERPYQKMFKVLKYIVDNKKAAL